MKQKIFQALKTRYSHLGLGDDILQDHAGALAKLGLITEDNLNVAIEAQEEYLSNLQKHNDRRANEAAAKAKKEAEDEAAKKKAAEEAAAKAAAEEAARKKAEEEAAAKKAAEEEAARKAAEEEAARKAEELKKNTEIPDWFKKMQEEQEAVAKKREEEYRAQIKALNDANAEALKQQQEAFAKLNETNKTLKEGYEAMKKEADAAKAAAEVRKRQDFIQSKAKEVGIPDWRIAEGFAFAADATEEAITTQLTTIANNVKTNMLPNKTAPFPLTDGKATKEEIDSIAEGLIN